MPDRENHVPRWVRISALATCVILAAAFGAMLLVPGHHGIGRHLGQGLSSADETATKNAVHADQP